MLTSRVRLRVHPGTAGPGAGCAAALALLAILAPTARAQTSPPTDAVRPRSALSPARLPPLPDSLRLYGTAIPVRTDLPSYAAPDGAARLSLSAAIATALARNPDRLAALLDAEIARRGAVPEAAGFAPTLDAGADLTGSASVPFGRSTAPGTTGGTGSSASRARLASSVGADVTAGYTLFDGFRRDATLRRLRASARGAALDADEAAEALVFAVVSAYVELLRQERLSIAREEALAVSTDRLRIEQARVTIGVAADVDAALALADLNTDRAALLRQRLSARAARIRLGRLLALDNPDALVATDALAPIGDATGAALGDADALARLAEATSRTVRAFEAREAVLRESVREVDAERLPTVRASAGLALTATDAALLPLLGPSLGPGLRYGLSASLPILDGGSRRRRLASARDRATQARLDTDAARQALRADLAVYAGQADGYRRLVALEDANVTVARQNVRVALAQQELGLLSPLDLRQIQLALVDAETRRIDALAALVTADASLLSRAGLLLPAEAAIAE